ncbi:MULTISPECIES: alcohol dehydrogenase catalytic domain-containing protein [Streptomyces]|nr:alcohol dehydrogenase catalytic domain-containing protein [Streptomyces melanosporofaciens]
MKRAHENLGKVVEVGSAVRKVKVGQYVVLPFNIACGFCKQCERGLTNYCLTMQPEPSAAGAAYGFADMGPYQGGQAEYLRVPYGDFNALRLGEDAEERQLDYVMLADIFPTGYHATEMAGVKPGDQTVVFGAGPVGLMGELEAQGKVPIGFGKLWFKGRRIGTGQAPVKRYNRMLRDLIAGGKAEPSWVVSHELGLDEAPSGYQHFDRRDEGWTKVVLHPDGSR